MKIAQSYYWAIAIAFCLGWLIHRQYYAAIKPPISPKSQPFHIPKITQNLWRQPLKDFKVDYISLSNDFNYYFGKYPFTDSIFLADAAIQWTEEEFLNLEQLPTGKAHGAGLQVKIDSNLFVAGRENDKAQAYTPAFIFNETLRDQYLLGMNWQPFCILEALNPEGIWRPIQMYRPYTCTTQMGYLRLAPQEFCVLALPSFDGAFSTQLRLRLHNGGQYVLSNTFKGNINRTQFQFAPDDPTKERLLEVSQNKWSSYFFGTIPVEMDNR